MKRIEWLVMAIVPAVVVILGTARAQPEQRSLSGRSGDFSAASDPRLSLDLEPAAQEILKQTMREHLQALHDIVAALAQQNYEKASAVAHEELGFPKHHQIMKQERGMAFPKKYQELAIAHHQAAEELAEAIQTKEMKRILQKMDETIGACLECHRAYKL
jgi:hypothetical protein